MRETTIVIPAYKPASLLKKCVDSIIANTDLNKTEVLVVCNGSDKESAQYLLSNPYIRFAWYAEPLGFTIAANIGLKMVRTPYVVLLNTDVEVLPFAPRDSWIDRLIQPFKDNPKIAVTGPADMYARNRLYLPFFCVGLRKDLLEKFNYLDEIFSPGYGEDVDFCFKVVDAGYELDLIAKNKTDESIQKYISDYPVFHQGQGSFEESGIMLAQRGHQIIHERYFKDKS
jgi:GT2 family glycosyltransferase